jgi:hypothetical protein
MAIKSFILGATHFDDFATIFRFLRSVDMRALISRGQAETLADILDARLPARVSLEQRTPKGTIYAHLNGAFFASVSQSGAVKYPKPRYTWSRPPKGYPLENNAKSD